MSGLRLKSGPGLPKGGFSGTAQDLKTELDAVVFESMKAYPNVSSLPAAGGLTTGTQAKVYDDGGASGYYRVTAGAWVKQKNLTDITEVLTGANVYQGGVLATEGYLASATGNFSAHATSKVSALIPVKPNTYYYLSGRTSSSKVVRCVEADGVTIHKSLNSNGIEYASSWNMTSSGNTEILNGIFKTKANSAFFQCNIAFSGTGVASGVMVQEIGAEVPVGYTPLPFESYVEYQKVKVANLPSDVVYSEAADARYKMRGEVEPVITEKKITLKDTPVLLLSGASYSEGYGSLKDKSAASLISGLLNWNFENFSKSGTTHIATSNDVLNGVTRNGLKISDLPGGVAIISLGSNESAYYSGVVDGKYYRENIIRLCENYKSYGFEPILMTYYGTNELQFSLATRQISSDYGYLFIDVQSAGRKLHKNIHQPWYFNSHYSTRSCVQQWYNTLKAIKNIDKPNKAIKIFRNRIASTTLNDFLFDDNYERLKYWKEISVGHWPLKNGFQKYVDRMDKVFYTNLSSQTVDLNALNSQVSEYNILRNSGTISIPDKAMVQAILPVVGKLDYVKLKLTTNNAVQVYVRRRVGNDLDLDMTGSSAAFSLDVLQTIPIGNVYTDSQNPGIDFTVVSQTDKLITCSASGAWVTAGISPGTLTGKSGSVPTPLAYNRLSSVPSAAYFADALKKKGVFEEVTGVNNVFEVVDPVNYLNYDKIDFLIKTTVATNISDVEVLYSGGQEKTKSRTSDIKSLALNDYGKTNVLPVTTFENSATNWALVNNSTQALQWDGIVNYNDPNAVSKQSNHIPLYFSGLAVQPATQILRLLPTDKISQSFAITQGVGESNVFKLRIVARYFPTDNTDENNLSADVITENTFDFSELTIRVEAANENYSKKVYVPLSFVEIEEDLFFESYSGNCKVVLTCETGNVELIKCEVLK